VSGFQVQNASHTSGLRVQIRVLWDKDEELNVAEAQALVVGAIPMTYMELEKRINAAWEAVEGGPGEVPGDAGPGPGEGDREAPGEGIQAGAPRVWTRCSCPLGRAHRPDCAFWEWAAEQDRLRKFREHYEAHFPVEDVPPPE
jgi:hypothetical protein